jgi:AcrR family transcriptional regulator
MTEPKITTRDRILETCRTLFNEHGPAEVTTAEIALSVGISEGNLHYHFRRKEQILAALLDRFEAAIERTAMPDDSVLNGPEPHRAYLQAWFNTIWEWRLFYGAGMVRLAPDLQPRLMQISDRAQAHARTFLQVLAARGVLRARPEDLERLVVNAWIVGIYWVAYIRSRQGARAITRAHLQWGFAQVEFLFAPYAATVGADPAPPD